MSSDVETVTCKSCLASFAPLGLFPGKFYSKVVGVTYDNPDGSSRQAIIARCRLGEQLILEAEPDNQHDPNAVKVLRTNGQQLGTWVRVSQPIFSRTFWLVRPFRAASAT